MAVKAMQGIRWEINMLGLLLKIKSKIIKAHIE